MRRCDLVGRSGANKHAGTMNSSDLQKTIDDAWENRDTVSPETTGAVRDAIDAALDGLDNGQFRVAEKAADNSWSVNQWLKKAVLL